jgi:hypothetical protein
LRADSVAGRTSAVSLRRRHVCGGDSMLCGAGSGRAARVAGRIMTMAATTARAAANITILTAVCRVEGRMPIYHLFCRPI